MSSFYCYFAFTSLILGPDMTSKAQEKEAMAEEFNRLEAELKQLQHEYADTRALNDELTKNIAEKEEELLTKDKRLENLRERNLADGDQLELELLTLTEKYEYEISTKEEIVLKLEIQYKRFQEIQKQNYELRVSVQAQSDQMENNRNEHALKMHEKNLEMKHLREDMEKKMRDQLNKMDISYQKDAFAALSDRHKKAMFQNAKLKDEVALQGVGLNNLGSRLAKQNQQHDVCIKELKSLHKRLRILKDRLASISSKKIDISRRKEEVTADEAALMKERADLQNTLETAPRVPECEHTREQLHMQILDAKCDVTMWTSRLNKLRDLNLSLKPVYGMELEGRFNPLTFPLEASVSLHSAVVGSTSRTRLGSQSVTSPTGSLHSHSGSPERDDQFPHPSQSHASPPQGPSGSSQGLLKGLHLHINTGGIPGYSVAESHATSAPHLVPMALKPSDIEEMMEKDGALAAALAPLRGKESALLATLPEEAEKAEKLSASMASGSQKFDGPKRDQNMIAWVALKIVDIWEEARIENERLKEHKFKLLEHLLTTLHSDGAAAALESFSGRAQRSLRSASHTPTNFAGKSGMLSMYSTGQLSPNLGPIQESEVSSLVQFTFDKPHEKLEAPAQAETSGISPAEDMAELLASGAQQILTLPPLRNTTKQVSVPLLPIKNPSDVSLDPRGGVLDTRQQERDWIESGELDEDNIADLWDEAFTMPATEAHYGQAELPVTSWLQRVPAAKRYPTTMLHMENMSPPTTKKASTLGSKGRKSRSGEGREGFSALSGGGDSVTNASMASLPAKSLTALLLCKDIQPLAANYNVGPPVMIDRNDDKAENTMTRSFTLPQLAASTREFDVPLHERIEDSGLEVTEEGLLLKDPLMGKKFAQTQKVVVRNTMKASAALKKSTAEQMKRAKSAAALAHGVEVASTSSSKMPKGKFQSMSSNFIHQNNHH